MLVIPLLLFFLSSTTNVSPAPLIRPVRISKQKYGDIIQIEELMKRRVFKSGSKLKEVKRVKWDRKDAYGNIVIPYTIAADYVDQAMENLSIAMKRIEDHTCIRFTKRKNEKYYVKIVNEKGGGCRTFVGRDLKKGFTICHLEFNKIDTCMHINSIIHELLHAIGLWHEQNNYYRDKYIKIIDDNIEPGNAAQFAKHINVDANIYNVSYDYMSVMHYERDAFSKNGEDTIVTLDPKYQQSNQAQPNEKALTLFDRAEQALQNSISNFAPSVGSLNSL